ncbi:hypothetical protein PILCRDRAFT_812871 [Piloderma croceum F 1598]|uniref:Wax synthase domain-containing protein n=1 Tax=Piloderma croceum (strain F 1598) TaxID=765440 RepID=A0A0C3GEE7_PILCF|nr:hypothetical protein PILCRDRAFT_812871 [Piloderma croceum F 1598]
MYLERQIGDLHLGPTDFKPPLPSFQYLALPQLFLSLIIAIRPSAAWRLLVFLLYIYVNMKAIAFTSGDKDRDFLLGVSFGWLIANAMHLLFLSDPMNDFRHVNDVVPPRDLPLAHRAYWAFCLQNAMRGIGWNYMLPHTPPPPTASRWSFVRSQCTRTLRYIFILDGAQCYMHLNPLFSRSLSGSGALPITAQGYVFSCANIIAYMGRIYCSFQLQYSLLSVLCVAIGFYEAKDFPPVFGRWRDAYTLRRFWGQLWHQMLRRFIASIGKSISRGLGFQPGTHLSSYTQLYVGFIVSGLLHTTGEAMVGMRYVGFSFLFFLAQAVAITAEDFVIGLARLTKIKIPAFLTSVIGYAWVFFWFSVSVPWFLNWQIAAGLGFSEAVPIMPVRHAVRMVNDTMNIDFTLLFDPL